NSISFLEQVPSPDAVPRLVRLLRDPVADVRAKAASALGEMEARDAVPQLIAALRDEAPVVRRASLLALADIRDISCLPALRRLLSDEDPEVRHDARIAILRLPDPPIRQATIAARENDHDKDGSGNESNRRNGDDRCGVDDFDWGFRPATYWPNDRRSSEDALENTTPVPGADTSRSVSDRLPPLKHGEVEIAMIRIRSSIGRILSLRVSRGEDDVIVYRIVDEASSANMILSSSENSGFPLTFRELTRRLLHPGHSTGAPVLRLLAREYGLSSIELSSEFYPQLNLWWRRSITFWRKNYPDR
ncbi:MAG: HEAT repeat domain-containing protein, partial [Planctomyces sp.]